MLLTRPPVPTEILYSLQFRSHQETKMAASQTHRLRSNGKIGDCEQSRFLSANRNGWKENETALGMERYMLFKGNKKQRK